MLKGVLRKSWLKEIGLRNVYSSKDNKVRSYSSSVVGLEFLFLSSRFAFALFLAKHTTEKIMAAPTRVPTKAPTMIPTSGSGGHKQLVRKVEHSVCLIHVHSWPVGNIRGIHIVGRCLVWAESVETPRTLSAGLIAGEERWLAWPCSLPIHIYTHKEKKICQLGGGGVALEMWFRTSLAVQWLRLCASTAGGAGSIPGRGTKILWHAPPHTKKMRFGEVSLHRSFAWAVRETRWRCNPVTREMTSVTGRHISPGFPKAWVK